MITVGEDRYTIIVYASPNKEFINFEQGSDMVCVAKKDVAALVGALFLEQLEVPANDNSQDL